MQSPPPTKITQNFRLRREDDLGECVNTYLIVLSACRAITTIYYQVNAMTYFALRKISEQQQLRLIFLHPLVRVRWRVHVFFFFFVSLLRVIIILSYSVDASLQNGVQDNDDEGPYNIIIIFIIRKRTIETRAREERTV